MNADHQAGDPVALVALDDPIGELDRLIDIALGNRRDECAIEQFAVLRIGAQRGKVERRR